VVQRSPESAVEAFTALADDCVGLGFGWDIRAEVLVYMSVVQRGPESAVEAFTALAGEHVSQGCPGGRSYAVYGQGLKVSVVQRAPQSAVEASTALAGEQVSKGWGMGAR
jgi:hypothetical protein